jgi:hypothetical protein
MQALKYMNALLPKKGNLLIANGSKRIDALYQ